MLFFFRCYLLVDRVYSKGTIRKVETLNLWEPLVEKLPTPDALAQNKCFDPSPDALLESIKEAVSVDLELSGKELKEVCEVTGLDRGFLSRIQSKASPVTPPARALAAWTVHVGSATLRTIAGAAGFDLVPHKLVPVAELNVLVSSSSMGASRVVESWAAALANDGQVDEDERAQIHAYGLGLLDQAQRLVEATRPR